MGGPSLDVPSSGDVRERGLPRPDLGPPSTRDWIVVYHTKSSHVQVALNGISTTACGWWKCGTLAQLAADADIAVGGVDPASDLGSAWCTRCHSNREETFIG